MFYYYYYYYSARKAGARRLPFGVTCTPLRWQGAPKATNFRGECPKMATERTPKNLLTRGNSRDFLGGVWSPPEQCSEGSAKNGHGATPNWKRWQEGHQTYRPRNSYIFSQGARRQGFPSADAIRTRSLMFYKFEAGLCWSLGPSVSLGCLMVSGVCFGYRASA